MSTVTESDRVIEELDVLVVGGGFSGIYQLERLRSLGFSVRLYEAGSDAGGVWHWNQYPGAKVDTEATLYQFSDERIWREWDWSEIFPGQEELQAYFRFVIKTLDLGRDIRFSTRVTAARFDEDTNMWTVESRDERTGGTFTTRARFFLPLLGTGSKALYPHIPGLDDFEGDAFHTSHWPEGYDTRGKRVAVIGTGASGLQVVQSIAPEVQHLSVFQRTPATALPMISRKLDHAANDELRTTYPDLFRHREKTFGGLEYDVIYAATSELSDEEFTATLEELWSKGGLQIWLGGYADMFFDAEVGNRIYEFWRQKTLPRIKDPILAEKLVPEVPPYPFGTKRCPLEYTYYESFNQDNVELIDVNETPIEKVTPRGIITADGREHEVDVIVLATGFDSFTGGLTDIDVRSTSDASFSEVFRGGARTTLGRATAGFPNILYVYGPQSPSAFCNGPTCAELEGDWVIDCLVYMRENGLTRIEATPEAEEEWHDHLETLAAATTFPLANSWYMNANVPGKKRELLAYPGGLPMYLEKCRESVINGYAGFVLS
ncbi:MULTISPECIES: NAD(P)/FAD-dependent oxidoreductase [unclassified Rhodococcus (in: high G+C Gram-positive bacteria)]|uniref:flavin-containing monooxygenase n=1 Tax=unclassified Rhodococcus (in: high G+C Gram-positive bacteria) TaxID=192944 RepID=UPI001639A9E0|nr:MULTISPECIES: NAD(P)/FAD-dependent oxidoreductase [unclassified Rhodococcus (in: high G+C Gram-positive bacteria)]MBC2640753.1 NAD(P)/FAD-dependent oxidoreductase [Rhodococcus sp. 3A]MBC2894502.1 NAD(P)/FAD-dependent oxidoreductase [Rhodococcus sp. 4CII]